MKCPLFPMTGKLIVQRESAESVTPGGIHLPDSAQKKSQRGKVLACGRPKKKFAEEANGDLPAEGATVLFGLYGGVQVEVDGDEYLVLDHDDVLAILEPKR